MNRISTRPDILDRASVPLTNRLHLFLALNCVKTGDQKLDTQLRHTGQNYDYNLNGVFFKDLGLADPDLYLDAVGDDLGAKPQDTNTPRGGAKKASLYPWGVCLCRYE